MSRVLTFIIMNILGAILIVAGLASVPDVPKPPALKSFKVYMDVMKSDEDRLGVKMLDRFRVDAINSDLYEFVDSDKTAGIVIHVCTTPVPGKNMSAMAWTMTFMETDGVEEHAGQGLYLIEPDGIAEAANMLFITVTEQLNAKLEAHNAKLKAEEAARKRAREQKQRRAA